VTEITKVFLSVDMPVRRSAALVVEEQNACFVVAGVQIGEEIIGARRGAARRIAANVARCPLLG
jgi:hypothetical protein